MIPISLTIKGLFAYRDEQRVDFDALARNNLFGIFGKVGSGKTAILDAITLALYGKIKRFDVELKPKDFLNLSADNFYVELVFRAGVEAKMYKSIVTGMRESKGEKVTVKKQLLRLKNHSGTNTPLSIEAENWEILRADIEDILGISLENFRRTVIIPQNQFQEFLSLGDADRSRMMNELFNLSQFQLREQTALLLKANETELKDVEKQMADIGDISEQLIQNQKIELRKLEDYLVEKNAERATQNTLDVELKNLKEKFDTLNRLEKAWQSAENDTPQYEVKKKSIETRDRVEKTFAPRLSRLNELRTKMAQEEKNGAELTYKKSALNKKMASQIDDLNALQKSLEEADINAQRAQDLRRIAHIKSLEKTHEKNAETWAEITEKYAQLDAARRTSKAELDALTAQSEDISQKMPDARVLDAIFNWFTKANSLAEKHQDALKTLANNADAIQLLRNKKQSICLDFGALNDADSKTVDGILSELSTQKSAKNAAINHLFAQKELATHAKNLTEGAPCPVCGATHHPEPLRPNDNFDAQIIDNQNFIQKIETAESALAGLKSQHSILNEQRLILKKNAENAAQILRGCREEFIWDGYSPDDFERLQNERALLSNLQTQRNDLDKKIKTQRILWEQSAQKLDEAERLKNDLNAQISGFNSEINLLKSQIQVLQIADFAAESNLIERAQHIENQIINNKKALAETEAQYRDTENTLANIEGMLAAHESTFSDLKKAVVESEQLLTDALNQNQIDRQTVESVLREAPFSEATRRDVAQFFENYAVLRAQRTQAIELLRGQQYDAEKHQTLASNIAQLERDISEKNQLIGSLRLRLERLMTDFVHYQNLAHQSTELAQRVDNLKVMSGLFRGEGFVKYVSGIYLNNICAAANARFQQLTHHTLQLTLDSDNQFKVVDLLNEGKQRDVKTLSGGQIFQAALSLALALSDNAQTVSKSPQNFFFLDEGFGALDADALQIVFDTLKSLRQENRIVGVISHVEAMQQEIDDALLVQLSPEGGSFITKKM